MSEPVLIEDREISSYSETGAHRALKTERELRKVAERKVRHLGDELARRVTALESRKPDLSPLLERMSEWRRDQSAEVGQLRAEVRELADAVDQLRSLIAQP